jgi:hypothetical protein
LNLIRFLFLLFFSRLGPTCHTSLPAASGPHLRAGHPQWPVHLLSLRAGPTVGSILPERHLSLALSLRPFSPLARCPTPLRRALRALAPGRCRAPVSSLLCRSAGPLPLPPSFLSPSSRALFPISSAWHSAELTQPSPCPPLMCRCRPPGPPLLCRVAAGQTCPPSFPRMGSRQPPPTSLAATPCLATSPFSCPRAAASFSWDVDARAP